MRLPRIAPDSPVASAGHRLAMTGALTGLAARSDRASRAVAAALAATAWGRLPREERAWADRIEAHRRRLPSEVASIPGRDARDLSASERLGEARSALRWMSLPPFLGRFLLRLVRELAPRSCLELGTGFGISTAYQAAALELNGKGSILSLDVPGMIEIAEPVLAALGLGDRVDLLPGAIDDTLASACERSTPIDYAFLDADHTEEGTVSAFHGIVNASPEGAVVVIDDIGWTSEMQAAWRAVREHRTVSTAVDLRRLGIAVVSVEGRRRSLKPNARVAPDSPAASAAHRALMTLRARRVAGHGHARSEPLARALRDAAADRFPPDEREWIGRIEVRRAEIPFAMTAAGSPSPLGIDMAPSLENDAPPPDAVARLARVWGACRWASIPPVWGRFLTRLIRELRPRRCLELGTGLGLSAAYQAASLELHGEGKLVTLEAHEEAARIAEQGFTALGLDGQVELRVGPIDETLPEVLEDLGPIDYALLDGAHTEAATTRHLDSLLPHLAEGALVVVDDITQTDEMRRAWQNLIGRERVSLALGLRRVGVVALCGPTEGTA